MSDNIIQFRAPDAKAALDAAEAAAYEAREIMRDAAADVADACMDARMPLPPGVAERTQHYRAARASYDAAAARARELED